MVFIERRHATFVQLLSLSLLISLDRATSHSLRGVEAVPQTSIMHEVDFVAPNDQIEGGTEERGEGKANSDFTASRIQSQAARCII